MTAEERQAEYTVSQILNLFSLLTPERQIALLQELNEKKKLHDGKGGISTEKI